MIALIFSNEEIYDIMKIVKSLEESRLLIKGVSETLLSIKKNLIKRFRCYFIGEFISR